MYISCVDKSVMCTISKSSCILALFTMAEYITSVYISSVDCVLFLGQHGEVFSTEDPEFCVLLEILRFSVKFVAWCPQKLSQPVTRIYSITHILCHEGSLSSEMASEGPKEPQGTQITVFMVYSTLCTYSTQHQLCGHITSVYFLDLKLEVHRTDVAL